MPTPRDSVNRKAAVTAVCLAVTVLAIFAAMNSYQVSARYSEQYPDAYGAGRAQLRFAPLIERVPATARIGYITDLEPSQDAYSAAFLAVQYALAPRQLIVVKQGQTTELAVGNFSKPVDYAAAGATLGYEVAGDFGNGVILYKRKAGT
jgi:hypothetical protein